MVVKMHDDEHESCSPHWRVERVAKRSWWLNERMDFQRWHLLILWEYRIIKVIRWLGFGAKWFEMSSLTSFLYLTNWNCPLTCIARLWRNQLRHCMVIFSWHSWRRSSSRVIIFMYDIVSEENSLHDHRYAFSRPFYVETFVPRCQRRYFNHTFYRSYYRNGMIACGLCFFRSLASLKIIPLVALGPLATFFPINLYHALKIRLNHRNQTDVSSLKDFSKNPYTFTYFCHHTVIYSFRNCFICFDFGHFFYNKEFFAFYKVFSTSCIAWRIIKLIAWTPHFWRNAWISKSRD